MFTTRLQVICDPEFSEILMAEIAEAGFDSFLETEEGFEAYTAGEAFDKQQLEFIRKKYHHVSPLIFFQDRIQKRNWNDEWEKSIQPVIVENKVIIRAEFHPASRSHPIEIVITPKMSFGTGHHQTTYLMVKNQLAIDHVGKKVMDVGCGTAILSILACKLGAARVEAFDIDEWSVVNGGENISNNKCHNIRLQRGRLVELSFDESFDILLANINKNILMEEMPQYVERLSPQGQILISGFFESDVPDLAGRASQLGLHVSGRDIRENWALLRLSRK